MLLQESVSRLKWMLTGNAVADKVSTEQSTTDEISQMVRL